MYEAFCKKNGPKQTCFNNNGQKKAMEQTMAFHF